MNETLGGPSGLAEKLKTDLERGLDGHDFDERDSVFGSNMSTPFKRTSKDRSYLLTRLLPTTLDCSRRFDAQGTYRGSCYLHRDRNDFQ